MIAIDMEMPTCCDDCPMLDDRWDYPECLITKEVRGYTFPVREKRMPDCPLSPLTPLTPQKEDDKNEILLQSEWY